MPKNRSDPRLAWPSEYRDALPGPVAYWTTTGFLLLVVISLGVYVATRKWRKETLDHRERLGVDTQARSAKRKDLRHLLVKQPDPHRLIIGKYRRWYVATESERQTGRRNRRSSGRGAVAHIEPSQSGKTTNIIHSVQHFGGPMILLSVKDDALIQTVSARQELGQVKTFDPTGVTGRCRRPSPLKPSRQPLSPETSSKASGKETNERPHPYTPTARSMLWAWTDPIVAEASKTTDIDLAWLLARNNTLYISSPPTDSERVALVLAGLLADLVDQLFAQTSGPPQPPPSDRCALVRRS